jgi:hypothetical protein
MCRSLSSLVMWFLLFQNPNSIVHSLAGRRGRGNAITTNVGRRDCRNGCFQWLGSSDYEVLAKVRKF